jgi:hypothetical protein
MEPYTVDNLKKDYPSRVSKNENSASVLISLIAGKPIAAWKWGNHDAVSCIARAVLENAALQ